eukprot:TRINITY_DN3358_c0_g2_i1.p1 TRINITY_DN3358_c0_g2~~TRINITY_DN3358_c0_g2_i1.p1  ORF type:complete len:528 (-),score=38.68 TRINITY_DN3358_c0_g2_i1:187-1770(-)
MSFQQDEPHDDSIVVLRLLYAFFDPPVPYFEFQEALSVFRISIKSALCCMRKAHQLSPDEFVSWMFTIDEINALDEARRKRAVQSVSKLTYTGSSKTKDFVMPVWSGTCYSEMLQLSWSSGSKRKDIGLPLLREPNNVVACSTGEFPFLERFLEITAFKIVVADVGSLPRGLEYFIEQCQAASQKIEAGIVPYSDLLRDTISSLKTRYPMSVLDAQAVREIVVMTLLQYKVSRNSKPAGFNRTYDELDQMGLVSLQGPELQCRVCLPFLWMKVYVDLYPLVWNNLFTSQWPNLMAPEYPTKWDYFEKLCGNYEALRTNLLLSYLKRQTANLGELFPSALGSKETLESSVTLQALIYAESTNRFPRSNSTPSAKTQLSPKTEKEMTIGWSTCGVVMKVGEGSPGFDVFSLRKRSDNDRYIAILTQCRFTRAGKTKLTTKALEEAFTESRKAFGFAFEDLTRWRNRNKKNKRYAEMFGILQNCDFVLVAISNRKLQGSEAEIPKGCLVICSDNLDVYFGPLTSRVRAIY